MKKTTSPVAWGCLLALAALISMNSCGRKERPRTVTGNEMEAGVDQAPVPNTPEPPLAVAPPQVPPPVPTEEPPAAPATEALWDEARPVAHYQGAKEQARGTYAGGTLVNADSLADSGDGWLKLYLPRDRAYATWDLVTIIQDAASLMARRFPGTERLQVGDMNAKNGGVISGHGSHTNGLDTDFAWLRKNHWEQDPSHTAGFEEVFVKDGKITANFDTERNWALVRAFYLTNRLNRIFMDEVIKRELCAYAKKNKLEDATVRTETLRRLRPWPHHQDHLHVRLTCPKNSPKCVPQDVPPAGDGCADVGA